jgi:hypothetical protein
LDLSAMVAAAERHGVSGFVADALAPHQDLVPPAAWTELNRAARGQIAQGLKIKRLTLRVLEALAREQVVPVLLKGAGLAQRLFPEQPLARPSSDVDVLVHPDELPRVRRAMESLQLTERADESLDDVFEEHHHFSFSSHAGLVEVHFRLFSGFGRGAFDDAALRSRFVPGVFEGHAVRWLSPEDEFVYLATHAANHAFLRISWLLDLQRALERGPALDWPTMGQRCREAGFRAAVTAALWLLEEGLRVTLPQGAHDAFPLRRARAWGHAVAFAPRRVESAELSAHRVWGFTLRLWLVDSPRHGIRHASDGARRLLRQLRAR